MLKVFCINDCRKREKNMNCSLATTTKILDNEVSTRNLKHFKTIRRPLWENNLSSNAVQKRIRLSLIFRANKKRINVHNLCGKCVFIFSNILY